MGRPTSTPGASIVDRLLASLRQEGTVTDVRIGLHWTAVAMSTPSGPRAGLAASQIPGDWEHGRPLVREAGRLIGQEGRALASLALAESPAERSLGFAAINALLEVDLLACSPAHTLPPRAPSGGAPRTGHSRQSPGGRSWRELNAEELILERCPGRHVAVVGHFPFVPRVREAARECWVLELRPEPGDLPAERAPDVIPRSDVVAITGMTLLNGTFERLAALARPEAYVILLGPSTPLSPILYDYGVDAISGTVVTDIPLVLACVSQGASFRQITGRRLVTMTRQGSRET